MANTTQTEKLTYPASDRALATRVNIAVFAIANTGAVEFNLESGGTFTAPGWVNLGGSAKQIVADENTESDGTLQAFASGSNNAAYTNKQITEGGAIFSGWNNLAGVVKQIALGQNQNGLLQLFAVGSNNAAYTDQQRAAGNDTAAGFTGWQGLGGVISQLAVGRNSDATLQVFAIGSNHAVYGRTQLTPGASTSGGFSNWQSFGGSVLQVAVGTNLSNQTLQFFVIGSNHAVYTKEQNILLAPQLLANAPLDVSGAGVLTAAELAPLVAAAEERWEVLGVSAGRFQGWRFQIDPLASGWLGAYLPGTIYLAPTADGYGWFVATADEDFTPAGSQELALPGTAAVGHIDLLTVVMHELGHALGLNDLNTGTDLMAESLAAGTRRRPTIADVDAVFAAVS